MQMPAVMSGQMVATVAVFRFGVHQGSVLSPLLFILVLEALSREFHSGVPWKMVDANKLSRPAVVWRGVNSESCYPYLPLNICH